ncbi:hypothetical protein, partial [Anaerophaga thermohalophila]|uniref:hypothetical protein n=1 Tax=Anaerophaga thermohalophila TaxID=177400 RepID=UPI0005C6FBD9
MKAKLITICLLTFLSINVFAQMNISTNFRQDGIWDDEKEEWSIFSTDDEEITFFEYNKDFTMFKHTTASITSAYMIKSQKYDEENERYEFDVVSDVGNKYYMIFDLKNENVRFIYEREGSLFLVQHSIKRVWFDEEDE